MMVDPRTCMLGSACGEWSIGHLLSKICPDESERLLLEKIRTWWLPRSIGKAEVQCQPPFPRYLVSMPHTMLVDGCLYRRAFGNMKDLGAVRLASHSWTSPKNPTPTNGSVHTRLSGWWSCRVRHFSGEEAPSSNSGPF